MRTFSTIVFILMASSPAMMSGAPSQSKQHDLPKQLRLDLLEATLRYRLKTQPLPTGASCIVYVNEGLGTGIDERLKEFRTVVRAGDVGPNPPKQRWYWLDIGKVTKHEAFVTIQDAQLGFKLVQLRRHNGRWIVMGEKPFYLT